MTLIQYLEAYGLSYWEFGELIETNHTSVRRYAKGESYPTYPRLKRIVEATEGEVTPNDLFAQCVETEARNQEQEA